MPTGWICPKCGRVWAPWVDRCDACCTTFCITGGEVPIWQPRDPIFNPPKTGNFPYGIYTTCQSQKSESPS